MEFVNFGFVGFDFVVFGIDIFVFFFNVEVEVFEKDDVFVIGFVDNFFYFGINVVGGESDFFVELFFKFGEDGF